MKRNKCSSIALIVLVVCDVLAVVGTRMKCFPLVVCAVIALVVGCAFLYGRRAENKHSRQSIFTNLLANAVSPSWLGAFYMLMFIIHISWLSDGSLFQNKVNAEVGTMVGLGIVGIIVLVLFFPEGKDKSDGKKTKLFVSGMSNLPTFKVELSKSSLIPLVSILQVAWEQYEKCEMLILKSDAMKSVPPLFIEGAEELRLNEFNEADCEAYGIEKTNELDERLCLIIKKVALAMFICSDDDEATREKKRIWVRDSLTIHFTQPCDYDDLPSCFSMLRYSLDRFDNSYQMYFNLTPGTTVISAIMTLLSIDDNRELYYYKQKPVAHRLQRVDKTKVPLENLLSQALETMRKS